MSVGCSGDGLNVVLDAPVVAVQGSLTVDGLAGDVATVSTRVTADVNGALARATALLAGLKPLQPLQQILMFGGISELDGAATAEVMRFDPATNRLGTGVPLPSARAFAAAVSFRSMACVVGGSYRGTAMGAVDCWDLAGGGWLSLPPMVTPRSNHVAVVLGDSLYALGGFGLGYVSACEVLSAFNTWAPIASLPNGLSGGVTDMAAVAHAGAIYLAGGSTSASPQAALFKYTVLSNAWTVQATMPLSRYAFALVALNGSLYAFGGNTLVKDGLIQPTPRIDRYFVANNTWQNSSLPDLPFPRDNINAVVLGADMPQTARILVFGGMSYTVPPPQLPFSEIDLATGSWSARPATLPNRNGQCAVLIPE
jgi:hypothetical protein